VQRLRSRGGIATPILLLTARGTLTERVEGLDTGAEDYYLVKPFEIDELLARIRAMLRRHPDTSAVLSLGSRSLRIDSRTVVGADAEPVELSKSESELLATLARRPDKLFTRPELLAAVFDPVDGSGTVDT
jgi:two-component system, OmpR family, response regulator QseB